MFLQIISPSHDVFKKFTCFIFCFWNWHLSVILIIVQGSTGLVLPFFGFFQKSKTNPAEPTATTKDTDDLANGTDTNILLLLFSVALAIAYL